MQNDVLKILITEEEIKAKVKEMGKQISKDYAQKNLMLIKGAVPGNKGTVLVIKDSVKA